MPSFLDGHGRTVQLAAKVGQGGEGAVFDVAHDPALVAKVYHAPVGDQRSSKFKAMTRLANTDLLRIAAWPTGTLHDAAAGHVVRGILLPKVAGHREIHQLYSPAQRRQHYPNVDWSFLVHVAMNCAAAFETVHSNGHVIGDVNQGGILVSPQGMVRLIDCDSFQVRDGGRLYHCVVAVPQFTPPELQSADFRAVERSQHHDCFGLALLIFHLLFMGRHPFAGRYAGAGDMTIERAISEGRFAFSRSARQFQMAPPPHSLELDWVSHGIGTLFEQAFARGAVTRPLAREWYQGLVQLRGNLIKCPSDVGHVYPRGVGRCPWCHIESGGGPAFFSAPGSTYEFDPSFDVVAVWRTISSLRRPPDENALTLPTRVAAIVAAPVPVAARFWLLGEPKLSPPAPNLVLEELPPIPVYAPAPTSTHPPFDMEVVPDAPPFAPEIIPSDPPLAQEDLPAEPRWAEPDEGAFKREQYRREVRHPEYVATMWAAWAITIITATVSWCGVAIAATGFVAAVGSLFWLSWLFLRLQMKKRMSAKLGAFRRRRQGLHADFEEQMRRYATKRREIDLFNNEAHSRWRAEVTRLASLRVGLEERNAQRLQRWSAEVERLALARQRAAAEYQRRYSAWQSEVKAIEARRVVEWERELKRVEECREAVHARNGERRQRWGEAMTRHGEAQVAIEAHNSKIANARRQHDEERARRVSRLEAAKATIQQARRAWGTEARAFQNEFDQSLERLRQAKREYESLKIEFERGRALLTQHLAEGQRRDFLRHTFIADHTIRGVGPARKAQLVSYGIESALDVIEQSILDVPGFGVGLAADLLAWRTEVERSFHFDPRKGLSDSELRSIHLHFQSRRQVLRRELQAGRELLEGIRIRGEEALCNLRTHLGDPATALWQAEADLAVMR